MTHYHDHPFAEIWPLMKDEALAALAADIKANGQHMPILLYQDSILDGRCRDRACGIAGVKPRYETADVANDDEALNLVVSLNEHRRHLSLEERAFAAARLANLKQGSNRFKTTIELSADSSTPDTANSKLPHSRSVREAAELMKVSEPSIARARSVIKHAPELEKDILAGKMSLTAADAQVRPKRKAAKAKKAAELTPYQRALENYATKHKSKFLTPQEVDPDFKGASIEFATKYGHVLLSTASEIERREAEKRAGDLLAWMKQCLLSAPPEASDTDLLTWIQGNGKEPGYRREKLEARWAEFDALYTRLAAQYAKLQSQLTGKPVEVKR